MIERVAIVISTHGLKGEIKVFSEIGELKQMISSGKVFYKNGDIVKVTVCIATTKKDVYRIKIEGVDSIEDAEKLVRKEFFANNEDFAKKGEILVSDLVGLKVFCINNNQMVEVGIVTEIVNYGRGNMIEVATNYTGCKKMLRAYPANFDFIDKINLKEKYLILKNYIVDIIV